MINFLSAIIHSTGAAAAVSAMSHSSRSSGGGSTPFPPDGAIVAKIVIAAHLISILIGILLQLRKKSDKDLVGGALMGVFALWAIMAAGSALAFIVFG